MTRKDYQMLAGVFSQQISALRTVRSVEDACDLVHFASEGIETTLQGMAYNLVQQLAADNERFDHIKFYEACGFRVENNYPQVFDSVTV